MKIFEQIPEINLLKLLKSAVHKSFEYMITSFQNDCIQYKPHINYMSLNPLAKLSLSTLITKINRLCCKTSTSSELPPPPPLSSSSDKRNIISVYHLARVIVVLFQLIQKLETVCLTFVDLKLVEKFIKENLLTNEYVESFTGFLVICCRFCESEEDVIIKGMLLECIDCILRQKWIWLRLNEMENYGIVNFVFDEFQKLHLFNTHSCQRWIKEIRDIYNVDDGCKVRETHRHHQQPLPYRVQKDDADDADTEIEQLSSSVDINKLSCDESEIDEEKMVQDDEQRVKQRVRAEAHKRAILIGKLIETEFDIAYEFEYESIRKSDGLLFFVSNFFLNIFIRNLFCRT